MKYKIIGKIIPPMAGNIAFSRNEYVLGKKGLKISEPLMFTPKKMETTIEMISPNTNRTTFRSFVC